MLAPQDYGAPTPAVLLDPVRNTDTVQILITSDSIRESNETFVVILSVLGEINGEINPDRATVIILDGECVDIGIISCCDVHPLPLRTPLSDWLQCN